MEPNNNLSADTLLPPEMAHKAEEIGTFKAKQNLVKTAVLAILAGAFIAFGAVFATLITSDSDLSYGVTKMLAGLAFSLGLILVVVGGAELFTGNNLLTMAWASRKVSTWQMLRNWIIVYLGNMFGAFSIVILMLLSGHYMFGRGVIGSNIIHIAEAKCQLGFIQAIVLGILCNILVCLAIWLCFSSQSTQGKILSIIFPITAFVSAGFEHSVANMYFIPMGLLVKNVANPSFWNLINASASQFESLKWNNYFINNLLPVTIGNIIGGGIFVGLAYWFIYLRNNNNSSNLRFLSN